MHNFFEIRDYFLNKANISRVEIPKEFYTSEGKKVFLYSAVIDLLTIKNIQIMKQHNYLLSDSHQVEVIFSNQLNELTDSNLIVLKPSNEGCSVYAPTSLGLECIDNYIEPFRRAKPVFEYKQRGFRTEVRNK